MSSYVKSLVNLLAPQSCVVCGGRLNVEEQELCPSCNLHLPRTHYWLHPSDNEMAQLFWGLMPVERCAALFFYSSHGPVSKAVYKLKYGDCPEIGERLGYFAAMEMKDTGFFEGIDALLPMPLAANRLRQRGYNQSLYIARGINEVTHLKVLGRVVKRAQFTESLTQKNRWQRMDSVQDMFTLRHPERVRGKHILIVDDIVTTGATVLSLGKELLKEENITISVLSLGFTKD